MISFVLVGLLCVSIDLGLYFTLTRTFAVFHHYYIATSFGASLVAITVSFFINSRLTFRAQRDFAHHYPRYLIIYIMGAVWQNTLLAIFVQYAGLSDVIAKPLAIVIVACGWNFLLAKFWVFGYTGRTETTPQRYGETNF